MTIAFASSSDAGQQCSPNGRLQGKIALITGANSGIGLATARQFVNEGATVFITGRRQSQLAAAAEEIGRNAISIPGDVSNVDDLDRLFAEIKQEKGKLDIVFANAGMARYAQLGEITEDFYSRYSTSTSRVCFSRCRRHLRSSRTAARSSSCRRLSEARDRLRTASTPPPRALDRRSSCRRRRAG
jgi:NAD(P)-dependent dehydrogenase (short-subunit alcohol dehydrogenase family)